MHTENFKNFIKTQSEFFETVDTDLSAREVILFRTVKVGEEYGELCDAVMSHLGKQRRDKLDKVEMGNLESEFADVIITTYMLAHALKIDVDTAIEEKMKKIQERYNAQIRA